MAKNSLPSECRAALETYLNPELFKALCDPKRLAILARLAVASRPMNVSDAAACCGVHLSGVSRHLSILKRAGVVSAEKHGREVSYLLNTSVLVETLRGLADAIEACAASATSAPVLS